MDNKSLDLITIGRSSVDLYGQQVGGRLEDMGSFKKYIGGSPTNIAAGCSRLGLATALITRVGDEHMGRFIREELVREGVDVTAVKTDPERLTALVLLGIRDEDSFPLIFYRENCADMGLTEKDIDPEFITKAKCLCATGTHLSHPDTAAAVRKALRIARENGSKTALDIDYRPNLWGLGGHDDGENRFVASGEVTAAIQSTVGIFDLIVGTEEEFHIAGGSDDTLAALKNVRAKTNAILVCKRGPMGAVAFRAEIPESLDQGETGPGFNVEVFNVLGAGDGFMAGFLKGWLTGEDLSTSLKYANACGAFAVSRHGCTPAYPSLEELEYFLANGSCTRSLRNDFSLEQIHWSTTRRAYWKDLTIVSLENMLMEPVLGNENQGLALAEKFKDAIVRSLLSEGLSDKNHGVIFPAGQGRTLTDKSTGHGLLVMKSLGVLGRDSVHEVEGNCENLSEWPLEHTVKLKLLVGNESSGCDEQMASLRRLFGNTRRNRLNLALELGFESNENHLRPDMIKSILGNGIVPDFWILMDLSDSEWSIAKRIILDNDPNTLGIISNNAQHLKPDSNDSSSLHGDRIVSSGKIIHWDGLKELYISWQNGKIAISEAEKEITNWLKFQFNQ
ncbi:MAG: 5-dehydro-2-deoxygluconokinase [Rhodobacteraceae bacterium]|nr:5-dehydro-2-deoxygluconokinase [Paracoccaceae bacterium]MCY4249055.1 5-dehydro-2-deoxygluconokinase [Paracoccaceae bacterium]